MGPWNKPYKRSAKETEYKSLCNDNKGRESIKPMAGWTIEDWFNCVI